LRRGTRGKDKVDKSADERWEREQRRCDQVFVRELWEFVEEEKLRLKDKFGKLRRIEVTELERKLNKLMGTVADLNSRNESLETRLEAKDSAIGMLKESAVRSVKALEAAEEHLQKFQERLDLAARVSCRSPTR
jgi:outer membrane murein-binding lipoprotein Lpp